MPQNCTKGPLGHIARVIRNRSVALTGCVVPDLVAAGGGTIELETACLEPAGDFTVAKSRQPAHSRPYNDRVILAGGCRGQRRHLLAFVAGLTEPGRDVPGDIERFRNRSALGNQARKVLGGGEIYALRKLFDVDSDCEFHPEMILPPKEGGNCVRALRPAFIRCSSK